MSIIPKTITDKTGMVTTGITVKNILENNAEEDCQKRKEGDK